jgi:hypothetical protein
VLAYEQPELRLIGVRAWDESGVTYDLNYYGVTAWGRELGLNVTPRVSTTLDDLVSQQASATGVEGWVLSYPDGLRVKIKTADYIRLHKALSGFCPKQVYEAVLADNAQPGALDAYLTGLPEEIQDEAKAYHTRMQIAVLNRADRVLSQYQGFAPLLLIGRREFAQEVSRSCSSADRVLQFALADGKDVQAIAWRQLRENLAELFADIPIDATGVCDA